MNLNRNCFKILLGFLFLILAFIGFDQRTLNKNTAQTKDTNSLAQRKIASQISPNPKASDPYQQKKDIPDLDPSLEAEGEGHLFQMGVRDQNSFQEFFREHGNLDLVLQEGSEKLRPLTKAKTLIIYYIGLGAIVENSEQYFKLMTSMEAQLAENSNEVLVLFNDHEAMSIIESDPFSHQMLINLIDKLHLPEGKKEELFGNQIAREILFDEDGNITLSSANLTNAMMLYSQKIPQKTKLREYLSRGLSMNKSARSYNEYLIRAKMFFPNGGS